MPTRAADLRHRIAFDCRAAITPAAGEDSGTVSGDWAEQFVVWTGRRYLVGSEPVLQSRLQGVQPVVLTVRASSQSRAITTEWRARETQSAVTYNIRAVTPDARGDFIDLLCEAGGADG